MGNKATYLPCRNIGKWEAFYPCLTPMAINSRRKHYGYIIPISQEKLSLHLLRTVYFRLKIQTR